MPAASVPCASVLLGLPVEPRCDRLCVAAQRGVHVISPAPAITHQSVSPADRRASTHYSHCSATICGPARACPAGLSKRSRRTFCNVPPTASRHQADGHQYLVGLSQRVRGIHTTSCVPVRCSPHAAEHQYLRRVRRRRVFRSASIRRHRKAGVRHPVFSTYCSLPALVVLTRDQGRNTARWFSPIDGSALRDPSTASTARSTGVDVGGTHFAFNERRARLLWRHGLFTHRRNLGVARRAARARQKQRRGFLMLSGR